MNTGSLKQKTTAFIQELRSIRDDAIRGNLAKDRTLLLMRTKLREYEEDVCAEPWPFPDNEARDFYKIVKWHYWNILYSLFGDELASIDPEFNRGEVPILLPGIGIFLPEQLGQSAQPTQGAIKELPPPPSPAKGTRPKTKEAAISFLEERLLIMIVKTKTGEVILMKTGVHIPEIYNALMGEYNDDAFTYSLILDILPKYRNALDMQRSRAKKRISNINKN